MQAPWRTGALRVALLVGLTCAPWPAQALPAPDGWREFQGTWTAVGHRTMLRLGGDRRASVADYTGSLMLTGPSRPGVGFRATAIVFNDTATGMAGRAVWTDERGDQVFSEIQSKAGDPGARIFGKFTGGTGRYAGATGSYQFAWRFLIEAEDGVVQGQSMGLTGRVRTAVPGGVAPTGRSPR